jgi:O-acetyl-ADP-ribose deacetylase (regulator of RNase III)
MSHAPTKVFICYKKRLEKADVGTRIVQQNTYAETIAEILNASGDHFVAWLDDADLPGGIEWENTIYTNLLDSDLVLVVIGHGTSQSEWVKREIALARAFGISVYPLGVGMTTDQLTSELKELDIAHLQGKVSQNVKLSARTALLAEIAGQLKEAARRTASAQAPILTKLLDRHAISPPRKAPDAQRAASFTLPHPDGALALHVAAGDVAQVYGIDVLVSSENDYMQMARFFESRTVSSTLRRRGAQLRDGRFDDTIQKEIDWHLEGRVRPLQPGECVVTSAGGRHSDLVMFNAAKYIVHVAAVQTVIAEARVAPFYQPHQIVDCVRGVLLKIGEINRCHGIVSPAGTDPHQLQEALAKDAYVPIRSVIFPLFGTGQGGADKGEVIELMLDGLQDFLSHRHHRGQLDGLADIYLSAFLEPDVEQLSNALRRRFAPLA